MRKRAIAITLLLAIATVGCGAEPERVELGELTVEETLSLEKAKAAAKELGSRLMAWLTEAIGEGGFANAIGVCKIAAPEVAAEVGAEKNIRIGRTSHQLRNPANRAPAWAAKIAADPVVAAETRAVRLPGGGLGVTLPIRLKNMCLSCHGPAGKISADVRAKLEEEYPDDAATGFAEGDLRGIFWVELP